MSMIFSPFERMVALRYLRARRQEGFISVIVWFSLIGIMLSVATLIVVMSVMNGFRIDLFGRVMGLNGHMNVYAMDGALVDYQAMLNRVRQVPDVVDASPTIEGQALLSKDGVASGAYIRGMDPDAIRRRPSIANHITFGSLQNFGDDNVIIGVRMAQRLGVTIGDTITLISPVSSNTVFGAAPRMRGYKIAAVFDVGLYEYDNSFVYMPLPAAQAFFKLGQGVSALEILVKDPQHLRSVRSDIVAAVGGGYRLVDWQQNNSAFVNAIQVEKNVMFLILTMMDIVASFTIICGIYMMVQSKGRDIAILRTMGATSGMVMRIFILNGMCVGIAGTIGGFLLGLFVAHNIEGLRKVVQFLTHTDPFNAQVYFLTHMPSVVDRTDVIEVVCMALVFAFLATLLPARRAARLDPVEALRYE